MPRRISFVCRIVVIAAFFIPEVVHAQEQETLLSGNTEITAAWGLESRTISIIDDLSASWGFFAGININQNMLVAVTLAANLTHPDVNYGYFGLLGTYTFNRDQLFHGGVGILLGSASAKDYARKKTSLFDNFGNTTGEGFYIFEPSVFGELNVSKRFRLNLGLGYRFASGLDETTEYTRLTGVTQEDLSGISVSLRGGWY